MHSKAKELKRPLEKKTNIFKVEYFLQKINKKYREKNESWQIPEKTKHDDKKDAPSNWYHMVDCTGSGLCKGWVSKETLVQALNQSSSLSSMILFIIDFGDNYVMNTVWFCQYYYTRVCRVLDGSSKNTADARFMLMSVVCGAGIRNRDCSSVM